MFSKIFSLFVKNVSKRYFLMVGLKGSGKTIILNKIKFKDMIITIPRIGFNVEIVENNNITFISFDIGWATNINPYSLYKYCLLDNQIINGIIFVVNFNKDEIDEVKWEFNKLLQNNDLYNLPLLILYNKQNYRQFLNNEELIKILKLNLIKNRVWCIQKIFSDKDIYKGIKWLEGHSIK
jgi:hypothetical protein